MVEKKCLRKFFLLGFFLVMAAGAVWAQAHDLVMQSAPDITSAVIANCKSPDIQLGAPFGAASAANTIVHGRTNRIYARFRVNGITDPLIPAFTPVQIEFYYRPAAFTGQAPPPITDSSWNYIGAIAADGMFTPDIYLALGTAWPDNYPSAANLCLDWTAPVSGNLFHIRAEAVYPPGYTDDHPADNTAVSLYEAVTVPHKVEVVLVHDVSGSMLSNTYAGQTYIEHARQRAKTFVAHMSANDKLAIVAFGGCLPGGVSTVWPAVGLSPMYALYKTSAIAAINSQIAVPSTSCLTPLGDGLQRAVDILTASGSGDPDVKKLILLLTDGYENSGAIRACSYSAVPPCASSTLLSSLQANKIQVYSVALGSVGWSNCIECLAVNSDGKWYDTPWPGVLLSEVYLDMQQAYEDDDLYKKNITTVGAGSDAYDVYFEGLDDTLYFILSWDNLNAEMNLVLTSPSGGKFDVTTFRDRGFVVHQVNKPEKGLWKYTVKGTSGEKYLAAVRSDKVGVRMSLAVSSRRIAGSAINIKAQLSGISPKAAAVKASVVFPYKQSADTRLSTLVRDYILNYKKLPLNPDDLKQNPDQNQKAVFIAKLFRDGIDPREIFPVNTVELPLTLNTDGTFSTTWAKDTTVAGTYTITVQSSGRTFERVYSDTVLLKPDKATPERSYADVLGLDTGINKMRQFVVRINCQDSYGNLATTPDLMKRLVLKYNNCEPAGKPEFAFDNTLQQIVNVPVGQKFEILVTLDGKIIPVRYY